jgi:hypothetical protein
VRGARAALIGGDDDAKAACGRKRKRVLLLDAKLWSENVHGEALEWLDDKSSREG